MDRFTDKAKVDKVMEQLVRDNPEWSMATTATTWEKAMISKMTYKQYFGYSIVTIVIVLVVLFLLTHGGIDFDIWDGA